MAGLDRDSLDLFVQSLHAMTREHLSDAKLLELDRNDEFPEHIVRDVFGKELGVQLLFLPEEHGGLGGSAFDIYRVSEEMARIDLGIATAVLATFLGSEPLAVGGTPEQKKKWLGKIADDGVLFAYGATEPSAGSDLAALRTVATRVMEDDRIVGYRITGAKQWISNGGYADAYTILANAPLGPSWFVVERGAAGFEPGKHEEKHGIRSSNTAPLTLENVPVGIDRLIGEKEGEGLKQAQAVFGYTRLMVAAFGLGAGWAALDRAIPYAQDRIQAGGPLSEKRGYTHKLIVPHAVRLEAARAYIEETASRIDAGEPMLNTEGAIAKYMATEAGNAAADAAIQALGGYGYVHEYMVEKIKRDVRITTIYEGTSEIMEMTISRDRWQIHLKTRGQHYHEEAKRLEALHVRQPKVGAGVAALSHHALAEMLERARVDKLTRHQHVLFRIGEIIANVECAGALARRAAARIEETMDPKADRRLSPVGLAAASRVFARTTALKTAHDGLAWIVGSAGTETGDAAAFGNTLGLPLVQRAQVGLVADLDFLADELCVRRSQ